MPEYTFTKEEFKKRIQVAVQLFALYLAQEFQEGAPTNEGYLKNNIRAENTGTGKAEITMPKYGIYLEYGTAPHMPPVDAIKEWASLKGIGNDEETAWRIAMSIKKKGTNPHPFMRPVLYNQLSEIFARALKDALD